MSLQRFGGPLALLCRQNVWGVDEKAWCTVHLAGGFLPVREPTIFESNVARILSVEMMAHHE